MIFLDSSAIIAFKNEDDVNHDAAEKLFKRVHDGEFGQMVISEFIFQEVTTVLAMRQSHKIAVDVGETLLLAKEIKTVKASDVFDETWGVFKAQERERTKFSFVDASTIVCLRNMGIKNLATFDKEFKKVDWINVVDG